MPNNLIPMVVDGAEFFGRSYDIYSMLLKNRIIFLGSPINQEVANVIVAQILYLGSEAPKQPIHMYINSPGGEVYAGFAMYDAMQMVDAPVYTYAVGMTASMATVLLAAGEPGQRYSLAHATIHQHPTSAGAKGYTPDVQIALREQERLQTQLFHLLGKHTGHSWQEVERDFTRDRFMHSHEAKQYGIVDHILGESNDVIMRLPTGEMSTIEMATAGYLEEKTNGVAHA